MPIIKITELTELTSGSLVGSDVLPIVDVSASETKKTTVESLLALAQPRLATAYAVSSDAHTATETYEDINSMSVTITPAMANSKLLCYFTCRIQMNDANWSHFKLRFILDSTTPTEEYIQSINASESTARYWLTTIHAVFENVSAAQHTIKVQWHDNGSNHDVVFTDRRVTVMACQ